MGAFLAFLLFILAVVCLPFVLIWAVYRLVFRRDIKPLRVIIRTAGFGFLLVASPVMVYLPLSIFGFSVSQETWQTLSLVVLLPGLITAAVMKYKNMEHPKYSEIKTLGVKEWVILRNIKGVYMLLIIVGSGMWLFPYWESRLFSFFR
jgi:hypothetical protein